MSVSPPTLPKYIKNIRINRVESENGRRYFDRLVTDPSGKCGGLVSVPEGSVRIQDQDRDGRRLHAAGRGAGGAADQHQDDAQELCGVRKFGKIGGIKAGGPCRHGLKQRGEDPLFERQSSVFREEKGNCRNEDQEQRHYEDQLGLQMAFTGVPAMNDQVFPGPEPQAAHNDQQHDGHIDQYTSGVPCERGVGLSGAHEVKSRIAESRYGVKYGI